MSGGFRPSWESTNRPTKVWAPAPKPRRKNRVPENRIKARNRGLRPGDLHPNWPEWTWDGTRFVKTSAYSS